MTVCRGRGERKIGGYGEGERGEGNKRGKVVLGTGVRGKEEGKW